MTGTPSLLPSFDSVSHPDDIGRLADLLVEAGLETLELSNQDGSRLFIRVSQPQSVQDERPSSSLHTGTPTHVHDTTVSVKTPYFGLLSYTHPLREEPFAPVGSTVQRSDVVALLTLETLQIPVLAGADGEVMEVTAQAGALVGFGTEIMKIRPISI
ncbi:biotin/lipoyl-containing protein [Acetobacter conturbans]|uniref:Acetyl-CoA carboxylase n=1 Tax=Acetobacter conturbans TaxID=1737472 RepID=A0ABX0K1X9_9PROT|nr:biotin/lipoyl-containing protein [Acetobacter conturbans]NHN89250.1 acetyl-CoA carboxylase [Acetobacter conturbans]